MWQPPHIIMKLSDLAGFGHVVVQCHDNPDADAIAAGFGVYRYLRWKGKQAELVYGGKEEIHKANLILMATALKIPIRHCGSLPEAELLVTVDCQYGEGNVTHFDARHVAILDHHIDMGHTADFKEVRSNYGSCAALVWQLLGQEGYPLGEDKDLMTALYYGLYMDTNSLSEISHPVDRDLRDTVKFHEGLMMQLRNTNLSIGEMQIAAEALKSYQYHEKGHFAIVKTQPCDPNILGFISDLMLQVDIIDLCVIYCELSYGIKLSVRSCIRTVRANELAQFLVKGVGGGGGHAQKAGGFIPKTNLELMSGEHDPGRFLYGRMEEYCETCELIYAKDYRFCADGMARYEKIPQRVGFVRLADFLKEGAQIMVRTLEADIDLTVEADSYAMIGARGEVYPIGREKFGRSYREVEGGFQITGDYLPVIHQKDTGEILPILPYAHACLPTGKTSIFAKRLTHTVKVFTAWDEDNYMLGCEGDYLAVRADDLHDVYIIAGTIFEESYRERDSV